MRRNFDKTPRGGAFGAGVTLPEKGGVAFVFVTLICACALSACGSAPGDAPGGDAQADVGADAGADAAADTGAPIDYDQRLAPLLSDAGAAPLGAPPAHSVAKVELGRMLFFDPILSGNLDTACSTCHRLSEGTTVHRSLVVGTYAVERDGRRMPGPDHSFTPRNPPPLFDLGDENVTSLLWDGRVSRNEQGELIIYDKSWEPNQSYLRFLSPQLDSLLAAQTMMPVLTRDEMRGDYGETDIEGNLNDLAAVPDQDLEGVWMRITDRLMASDQYRQMFEQAYPDTAPEDFEFAHASNALSAFMVEAFTFDDSPFDHYLRGDTDALTDQQKRGAFLFYGKADCASCHGGPNLTDEALYNIGVRPIGTGPSTHYESDLGAVLRSNAGVDKKYAFRTPSLRNVELTGPWMHNGAYTTLEGAVRHHLDYKAALWNYDPSQLDEEFQRYVHQREEDIAEVEETLEPVEPIELSDAEVDDLVAFLESLTSPSATDLEGLRPEAVPSGYPVPDP